MFNLQCQKPSPWSRQYSLTYVRHEVIIWRHTLGHSHTEHHQARPSTAQFWHHGGKELCFQTSMLINFKGVVKLNRQNHVLTIKCNVRGEIWLLNVLSELVVVQVLKACIKAGKHSSIGYIHFAVSQQALSVLFKIGHGGNLCGWECVCEGGGASSPIYKARCVCSCEKCLLRC